MIESTSLKNPKQSLGTMSSRKISPLPPAPDTKNAEHSQLSRAMALGSYFVSGLFAYAMATISYFPFTVVFYLPERLHI